MATQEYAASIQGVAIRVTRLDASGNLLNGAGDSYTTSAFMRISFTPEYEEGDEIVEKSANGSICVSYKAPDTLKRVTMELAICEPDPELTNLISGGLLLRKDMGSIATADYKSIGWASPNVGDDPSGNGVAIEAWSFAVKAGKRAASLPYFHWVFPYARLRQSGDRVIENGMLATTFEGYGLGNALFNEGSDGRWEFPLATERPYSYARSSWAPTGRTGFYTWHDVLTASVTKKQISQSALAGQQGIITTAANHSFAVGEQVTISSVGADFNGVKTITSVTTVSPWKFTFASSATDAAETAVSPAGTATVPAGSRQVTALPDENTSKVSAAGFNVPGSVEYNADENIDFVLVSNVSPSA
jgi:hypothetical protein